MPSIKLLAVLGTNPLCSTRSSYPTQDLHLADATFTDLAALVVGAMAVLPELMVVGDSFSYACAPSSSFGGHSFVELRWPVGEATASPPKGFEELR
ncbi:unnamed protein product [Urochloa humidicola]